MWPSDVIAWVCIPGASLQGILKAHAMYAHLVDTLVMLKSTFGIANNMHVSQSIKCI